MTCRRICRELIELFRFHELDMRSAPHLDHLAECRACRDEVGFDRALVQQLRVTLQQRIASAYPSSTAWTAVLARAQASEQRGLAAWFHGRSALVLARLRFATAVSATALAVVVASSTQIGIGQTQVPLAEAERISSSTAERFERQVLGPRPRTELVALRSSPRVVYVPQRPPSDPEARLIASASAPVVPIGEESQAQESEREPAGPTIVIERRGNGSSPADRSASDATRSAPAARVWIEPLTMVAGEPS